jgi:hypothetical protein
MTNFFTRELLVNLIFVFFITGTWDIILRLMSQGYIKFLGIENMKWVKVLKDYFDKHTLLAAFLIAALVGAIAYICIMYTYLVINLNNCTFNSIFNIRTTRISNEIFWIISYIRRTLL